MAKKGSIFMGVLILVACILLVLLGIAVQHVPNVNNNPPLISAGGFNGVGGSDNNFLITNNSSIPLLGLHVPAPGNA